MYKLVGVDGLGNYAVYDSETNEVEAINGSDLKLCLSVGLSVAGTYLNDKGDIVYTEEYFPKQLEFDDEDEDDYDDYDDYEEDEDYSDDYSDDEEYEDDYDDYEDSDEEEYEDSDDEDYDYGDYDDTDDSFASQREYTPEDSTMSKLFSRLSGEQVAVLQEYYLYMSQRIFDLKTGNAQLTLRKSDDLKALKNTGGTWHYAGFIDMGYKGSSVCPNCYSNMTRHAISSCCETPIISYRNGDSFRTYNGTCDCCGARCSAVVRKVALRTIDRTNQNGVVCDVCNNELEQSSHYCTFNHPVRFMHVAWDVSKTDIEVGLFGQLATQKLEDIIDSNNCIKFGLDCIADFFDIPKDSEAFKALKDVQDTCVNDMKSLETLYANYSDVNEVNKDFTILDGYAKIIGAYNIRASFLGDEVMIPEKLITSYTKMRQLGMIPPKSLIQYIRDYILDWKTHKFTDKSKKYPTLIHSVGSIHGVLSNSRMDKVSNVSLSKLVSKCFGKEADFLSKFILVTMNNDFHFCDNFHYRYDVSFFNRLVANYITVLFTYEICGFYKYNALPSSFPNASSDEGGSSRDEFGKHAVELKNTYYNLEKYFFKDFSYDCDFFMKLVKLYSMLDIVHNQLDVTKYNSNTYSVNEVDNKDVYSVSSTERYSSSVIEKYCTKNNVNYSDLTLIISFINSYRNTDNFSIFPGQQRVGRVTNLSDNTIDENITRLEELINLFNTHKDSFSEFQLANIQAYVDKKNAEVGEEVKRKAEEMRLKEEARQQAQADLDNVKSEKEVIAWLATQDLSGVSSKYDFAKKLVNQLSDSGKEPSSKQFYYIKPLFEEVSKKQFNSAPQTSEKVNLSDRKDIEEAIDYCLSNKDKLDSDRTASILQSIKRMGTISERQMKYAEQALSIFNETHS